MALSANCSAPARGSPPEEELLELELLLLELEELLASPDEEEELAISPDEVLDDEPTPPLPLVELELDEEEPGSPLDEELLLASLPELELELEASLPELELELAMSPLELDEEPPSAPEEEEDELLPPIGGGVGLDPPLLHPCKARAPTVNSSSARFFKVSLLYVLYL